VRVIEDRELIKKVKNGDKEAFQPLVQKYGSLVYTAALKIVGDPGAAEDIAQETFWQAYRSLASFQFNSSFSTWLFRIGVNKALDYRRQQKRKPPCLEMNHIYENLPSNYQDPEYAFLVKESESILKSQIMDLPDIYRRVIYEHYCNQRSYKEIALIEGVSVKTIESRIYRAKVTLKKMAEGGAESGKKMPDS
jgi:RNA polymerase sigma factor (sigma-70 family)